MQKSFLCSVFVSGRRAKLEKEEEVAIALRHCPVSGTVLWLCCFFNSIAGGGGHGGSSVEIPAFILLRFCVVLGYLVVLGPSLP